MQKEKNEGIGMQTNSFANCKRSAAFALLSPTKSGLLRLAETDPLFGSAFL